MNSERTPWKPDTNLILDEIFSGLSERDYLGRMRALTCAMPARFMADGIIKQMIFVARNERGAT